MELESQVIKRYAETFDVNVLPCGHIIQPDGPRLGPSSDGKVVDPSDDPLYCLVEVKCPDAKDIGETSHNQTVSLLRVK